MREITWSVKGAQNVLWQSLADVDLTYWTPKVEHNSRIYGHFQQHLYCACKFRHRRLIRRPRFRTRVQNFGDLATFSVDFYRAILCIRDSHGPVSVRLSVTSRSSTKTAERRITQITPHDYIGTLVFWSERSPRNSTGVTPYWGAKCRWGGSKSATFDIYPSISRKRYKIDT